MAQLGSVCRRYGDGYPCNIIEARTMKASWILAHEIGHKYDSLLVNILVILIIIILVLECIMMQMVNVTQTFIL